MWSCSHCSQPIEDHFDICWNCQFAKDGTLQPVFEDMAVQAKSALETYLQPGESLELSAHGVRSSSIRMRLLLALLGIAWALLAPFALQANFSGHLSSGEATRVSTAALIVLLATLFYIVAKQLTTRRCFVGLTDRRFIALVCKDSLEIKESMEYELERLPPVRIYRRANETVIKVHESRRPLIVKIHETGLADNLRQAEKITAVISKSSDRNPDNDSTDG